MRYISTRGQSEPLAFDEVLLTGLATDGGLYVPMEWPQYSETDLAEMRGMSYAELLYRVIHPFVDGCIADDRLRVIVDETCAAFRHQAVAPLKQLSAGRWMMELFHGPTLAFKDYALQLVGRLFSEVLAARGERVTIIGATSGDTGSSAIEACRDRDNIDIFILHPQGRVSEVQRRQMTTVASANVHNVAIDGTFDDCQDLVKSLFNDSDARATFRLGAVNSINWARIMAQIVYYAWASLALGGERREVNFAVPTGNFGNIYAGFCARTMGFPVGRLVVGTNQNDILARFMATGEMSILGVSPSLSPSMDIQVSSNFERLLFEAMDRNSEQLRSWMQEFRAAGSARAPQDAWERIRTEFSAHRYDDEDTKSWIDDTWKKTGELVDPHTAIGIAAAADECSDGREPIVSISTAHPAKFPDAVESATGMRPPLPPFLADLFEREERCVSLPNSAEAVVAHIAATLG